MKSLANDSQLSVVEFMRKHASLHSEMIYDITRKGFVLDKCKDTTTGIYFIVSKDTNDIQKIGKAEGKLGLKGRVQTYRSKLASRTNDQTVKIFYEAMTGPLLGITLEMYILPLPPQTIDFHGFIVELQMARSLELALSKRAIEEENSMHLSGQN